MTAGTPGRPVAPGTVGRRRAGLSSAGELPGLTGTVVAGILMLAPWGPAAALGICAFTVPNWHTPSILLQKPFRAATAQLAGLVLLTHDSLLQV